VELTRKEKQLGFIATGIGVGVLGVPLLLLFLFNPETSRVSNNKQPPEKDRPRSSSRFEPPDHREYDYYESRSSGRSLIDWFGSTVQGIVVMIFLLIIYMVPAGIAYYRKHASWMAILVLTVVLGWTGIGWALALVWALANKGQNTFVVINNQSQDPQVVINNAKNPTPNS